MRDSKHRDPSRVFAGAIEPALLAFHIYVTDDESSEVVVQIHPDAESMQHHLRELGEKVRATGEFTDFDSLEIYGEPSDGLRKWVGASSNSVTWSGLLETA